MKVPVHLVMLAGFSAPATEPLRTFRWTYHSALPQCGQYGQCDTVTFESQNIKLCLLVFIVAERRNVNVHMALDGHRSRDLLNTLLAVRLKRSD